MFKTGMASALSGALLTITVVAGQAAPAAKPGVATSEGVTLVGRAGPRIGGFRGGGPRIGGFGGGPRIGGVNPRIGGFALRGGGGPRIGRFGGGQRFFRGGGSPRFAYRGARGFKAHRGPRFAHGFKHRRFHKRRRFHGYAFYGAPVYYGAYGYGSGCGWLYRQAIRTGSRYWWRRYEACRDGYYDRY